MRKYILAAALAAGTIAGTFAAPAMAQERAPFTGLKVEGIGGWDRLKVPGDRADGILYGAGIGYDANLGNMVVGVEGEATGSTADECTTGVNRAGDRLCGKLGRDLYVGGRVGAVVGSSTLLYAKAGYTNARLRLTYTDGLAGTGNYNLGQNKDGWRVGGGIEHAIGTNAYVKAEYRYSTYSDRFDKHQVVGGVGFRF